VTEPDEQIPTATASLTKWRVFLDRLFDPDDDVHFPPELLNETFHETVYPLNFEEYNFEINHVALLVGAFRREMRGLDDEYEAANADPLEAAVALEIYRKLTGIKNSPQLMGHLRVSKYQDDRPIHEILALGEIPHPNTLDNARKNRFNREISEFISHWVMRLGTIAAQHDLVFPDVDDKRLYNNGGVTEVPIESKRGYAHGALDLLREDMPIEKDEEVATWTDYGKHFDFSLHLCDTGGTPEGELENFADNRGLQKGVDLFRSAETFRNDIYRVGIEEWEDTFDRWTRRILDAAYPESLRSRDLAISVDATNIPTWSSETSDLDGVVGTEKLDNTHYAYQILSAISVSDGLPFQLAHELQMSGQRKDERLEDLIEAIRDQGCDIGLLLADADFSSGRVANLLKDEGIDFVIAYPKHRVTQHTEAWEDAGQTFGIKSGYVIRKDATPPTRAEVNLFGEYQSKIGHAPDGAQSSLSDFFDPEGAYVADRQDQRTLAEFARREDAGDVFEADNRMRWFTFMTNLDLDEEQARALREYYHYRWAIESAYSLYKQHFLPSTKSTNLGMRTYLYLFGMTAYNAWVAANAKARRQHLEDSERNRPPIRASRFMTIGQQRYRTDEFHVDYTDF
jgi:hypothetical protein